jgi:hypothetical protein
MTRNPMSHLGTINALSADVRSILRPRGSYVMRAYKPGCSFDTQSEPKRSD